MVIVISIIILLAGLVLPAASQMWRDRKLADAQNMVSGMLMVARAKALEGNAGETGLFFYVDDQNVQHVAAISQDSGDGRNNWQTQSQWQNVFTVTNGRNYSIPAPMRVVPRYTVCEPVGNKSTCDPNAATPPPAYTLVSNDELENNDFANPPAGTDVAQRHRNFFAIIYSPNGELKVNRDVLIRDVDADCDENPGGDVTGFHVGTSDCNTPGVARFYAKDSETPYTPVNMPTNATVDYLVSDKNDVALNFPSVDGMLVYDDSLFNESGDASAKRKYLLQSAQPFYIQRLTGAVVRGPVGEGPTTP
jgi:type II secretory pathway pseudopilin PulG